MMEPNENSALLQAFKSDDESALTIIYDRYSKQVYKLSLYLLKDTGWSEDVVQEVFIKLWNNRQKIDTAGDIWTLLYVMTKRTSLNKLRNVGKTKVGLERMWANVNSASYSVHEFFIAKELNNHLGNLFDNLPVRQKEILSLSRDYGLSYKEIADQLGVSPHTVKNHLVQALKKMKKYIKVLNFL